MSKVKLSEVSLAYLCHILFFLPMHHDFFYISMIDKISTTITVQRIRHRCLPLKQHQKTPLIDRRQFSDTEICAKLSYFESLMGLIAYCTALPPHVAECFYAFAYLVGHTLLKRSSTWQAFMGCF